ncbi:winged helix-turn-helix domain-containing protein [Actinocatenispora rupis]|nr:helix-turn-helix domain-containing protein [Actinocatenispora rupis]
MTTEDRPVDAALVHPVRAALLDLVRELGTVTSTEAARRLGHSTGLCSFHLRQLARFGYIEEAPARGRIRPWRLRTVRSAPVGAGLGTLSVELEDEGYRRWLARRDDAPRRWRRDAADSAVLYLTPDELTAVAGEIRAVLDRYSEREHDPAARPTGAGPVGAVTRLFPLLPEIRTAGAPHADDTSGHRPRAAAKRLPADRERPGEQQAKRLSAGRKRTADGEAKRLDAGRRAERSRDHDDHTGRRPGEYSVENRTKDEA